MNPIPVTAKPAAGPAESAAGTATQGTAAQGTAAQGTAGSAAPSAAGTTSPGPAAGRVAFVGAGPGDEGLLTLRAAALLGQADLVVASPAISGRLAHLLRPAAVVTDSAALDQDPRLLAKAAKAGQLVIRLYGGDPFLFCNAAAEAAACVKARVPIEIVPSGTREERGVALLERTNARVRDMKVCTKDK